MPSIQRPRLIWDEDCEFCRVWIAYWRTLTGDSIEYTPYQQAAADYPHIPLKDFQASVHLMSTDGTHTTGAHAVFSSLSCRKQLRWLLALYAHLPLFRFITEALYRNVASHRGFYLKLTRLIFRE